MSLWDDEDYDRYVGQGSLHATDSGFNGEPVLVRPRPLGFTADVDQKPVYRVRARRRELKA